MGDIDWIHMMEQMQDIRLFSRLNVRRKRQSECFSSEALDLLSRIALTEGPVTPLNLSVQTGLTKPMVSKLIESLNQQGFLTKERAEKDRRSYFLAITEKGHQELNTTYTYYLEPVYELRRNLGERDFAKLMSLIKKANKNSRGRKERANESL